MHKDTKDMLKDFASEVASGAAKKSSSRMPTRKQIVLRLVAASESGQMRPDVFVECWRLIAQLMGLVGDRPRGKVGVSQLQSLSREGRALLIAEARKKQKQKGSVVDPEDSQVLAEADIEKKKELAKALGVEWERASKWSLEQLEIMVMEREKGTARPPSLSPEERVQLQKASDKERANLIAAYHRSKTQTL